MSTKLSVLIIEDEAVLRTAYTLILDKNGYAVESAANGMEGLILLKKTKPKVVLVDIFMPVMDGKEFMKNVDIELYPNTKFIVYSNLSDPKTEAEMLALGAHDFILKSSMSPQNLVQLIADTFGSDAPDSRAHD